MQTTIRISAGGLAPPTIFNSETTDSIDLTGLRIGLYDRSMLKQVRRHHDFMWSYLKALLKGLTRPAILFITVFANSLIAISAYLFYMLEYPLNPTVKEPIDALYFAVTTVTTVGFGDVHPVTTPGKILAMVMMLFGTGIFVSFTAVLASIIMEIEPRERSN